MRRLSFRTLAAALCCAAGLTVSVSADSGSIIGNGGSARVAAEAQFQAENPGTQFYRTAGAITTISHDSFSFGATAEESANAFLAKHVGLFGVNLADLVPGSLSSDGAHSHQVMPLDGPLDGSVAANPAYKFTLLSYLQTKDGIPVYRADLRLLVRNEAGAPLVLARSGLRDLGDFVVPAAKANVQGALDDATLRFPGAHNITPPQTVIYAGDADHPAAPVMALVFDLDVGQTGDANYARWRVIADAATGKAITTESLIHNTDVSGNISAQVTTGFKSAECNPEALTGLPYARASIGATVAYADANGNFTVPNAGTAAVTVVGSLQGKYFNVFNPTALAPTVSGSFTPPGPANLVLNAANTDEFRRAEANAYWFANTARTLALTASPTYPIIGTQADFRINTSAGGSCTSFYDGTSINFTQSVFGGCSNFAYSDFVVHEYGHHLVNVAGSGQGQYGEGTGDCIALLIDDQPSFGLGYLKSSCNLLKRTANNRLQYPQFGEIHDAGQLLSGCVWDLRNELAVSEPSNYPTILRRIVVNAILLHTGETITPQISTDYLTLDDDDGNLANGTPRSCEILRSFGRRDMAKAVFFHYGNGRPLTISPGGETINVTVEDPCALSAPGILRAYLGVGVGNSFNDAVYLPEIAPSTYRFDLPAASCGTPIRYYLGMNYREGSDFFEPRWATSNYYTAISGFGLRTVFADNFETDKGWTSTASGAITGMWERAVPANNPFGAAPIADYDGSGFCYITQNNPGTSIGDFDIDNGWVIADQPDDQRFGGHGVCLLLPLVQRQSGRRYR